LRATYRSDGAVGESTSVLRAQPRDPRDSEIGKGPADHARGCIRSTHRARARPVPLRGASAWKSQYEFLYAVRDHLNILNDALVRFPSVRQRHPGPSIDGE